MKSLAFVILIFFTFFSAVNIMNSMARQMGNMHFGIPPQVKGISIKNDSSRRDSSSGNNSANSSQSSDPQGGNRDTPDQAGLTPTPALSPLNNLIAVVQNELHPTPTLVLTATPTQSRQAPTAMSPTPFPTPTPTPFFEPTIEYRIALGPEQSVPSLDLKYIPDGHISKIESDGSTTLFVTALNKSYIMNGNSVDNLSFYTDASGSAIPVLSPSSTGFDMSYAGFGSVISNPVTKHLIGIYHGEVRTSPDASDTQVSSIGIAVSTDNGLTWNKKGEIITGLHQLPLGTKTSGAGQPCAIIMGNYIYLYYVDWNYDILPSIHLARALLSSDGLPGNWYKYKNGDFTTAGINGASDPVIYPMAWNKPIYYAGNPGISYNDYLKKYLMIFETNLGFFSGVSSDGIHWGSFQQFYTFPKDASIPKSIGDVWYSYPTYLSQGTADDTKTTSSGILFYSRGIFGQYHLMVKRTLTLH